ncbi:Fc.00g024140.m01.CDS01 [Cosmosporella sp. VM-42]
MSTQKAIVVYPEPKAVAIRDIPIPEPRDEWVLVKVKAVALNAADCKAIDYGAADAGSRIGCDFAGIVEKVGGKVTKFKVGDRIAGFSHGGNSDDHETGAFGEYVLAKDHAQIKIPDKISFEEATTVGLGMLACGQGLYKSLGLPLPNAPAKEPFPVLFYGGSTATAILGIQYAKASGLTVVAAASPPHFDYLKSLGADAVFDYRSPTCAADIKAFTNNKLRHAWDCLGVGTEICAAALSDTEPSQYGVIGPSNAEVLKKINPLAEGPKLTLAYSAVGQKWHFLGNEIPSDPSEVEFFTKFSVITQELLEKRVIKTIMPTVNQGGSGLGGVLKGLDDVRAHKVSGTKLVYTL